MNAIRLRSVAESTRYTDSITSRLAWYRAAEVGRSPSVRAGGAPAAGGVELPRRTLEGVRRAATLVRVLPIIPERLT